MGSHRLKLKTKTGLCQVVSMSREQNLLGALNVSSCYLYTCLCFLVILTTPPKKKTQTKNPKPKLQTFVIIYGLMHRSELNGLAWEKLSACESEHVTPFLHSMSGLP